MIYSPSLQQLQPRRIPALLFHLRANLYAPVDISLAIYL